MSKIWIEKLKEQRACRDGLAWAYEQSSAQAAWDACERADWMLWAWAQNCGAQGSESHRKLVLACVEIAKTGLKYIKNKELKELVEKSLNTTERWVKGEDGVTLEDVKNAAEAAGVAADAADAWAAGTAARYAARSARSAGYSAADASRYAAWATTTTTTAYYAAESAVTADAAAGAAGASYSTSRQKTLKGCADIIRKIQSDCPEFKMVTG